MNYWMETEGIDDDLLSAPKGASVVVQQWFTSARVVEALDRRSHDSLE
jgi:hypothetical protein